MTTPTSATPVAGSLGTLANADTLHALRNAVKLGASLILTWAVALAVRLILPRHLGPELFGAFQVADAITATTFVLITFGMEVYIRKEVTTRRDHASEFLGGVHLVRVVLSVIIALVLVAVLAHAGKPATVLRLVLVLGLAQLLIATNGTYSALLHSVGAVTGLSILNVASKVVWGLGIVTAFEFGKGVDYVAWAMTLSEAVRLVALVVITHRHIPMRNKIDLRGTKAVLLSALPFFLTDVARTAYGRVDVSAMSFLASDLEVGWYAAASNLAGLTMLITPLIFGVLLPLSSRAQARSDEELVTLTRRAMELILVIAIPITLIMCLGADVIVDVAFGAEFGPAAASLRVLAPMFVLTYVAIVSSITLIRIERGWTVTILLWSCLAAFPGLSWVLVPRFAAALGRGGAGVGAAVTLVSLETLMTAAMTFIVWRRTFDRRTGVMLAKTGAVCVVVVAADWMMSSLGGMRVIADTLLYTTLIVAVKAVDVREIVQFVRQASAHRGGTYERSF